MAHNSANLKYLIWYLISIYMHVTQHKTHAKQICNWQCNDKILCFVKGVVLHIKVQGLKNRVVSKK